MRLLQNDFLNEDTFGVEDDFCHEAVATGVAQDNGFTFTHAAGAIACGDGVRGVATITSTAGDNEFNSILTTNEIFRYLIGKPIRFVALGVLPVLLPNENNIFVGCMENMDTATEFAAAGAGMRALCGDIFGFFTPEAGGTVYPATEDFWFCISGHNDLEQITPLNAANPDNLGGIDIKAQAGGVGIEHDLYAEWVPTNAVPGVGGVAPTIFDAEVRFWVDGVLVCKHRQVGVYQITAATTQAMNFGIVTENITDICSVDVDYIKCRQLR